MMKHVDMSWYPQLQCAKYMSTCVHVYTCRHVYVHVVWVIINTMSEISFTDCECVYMWVYMYVCVICLLNLATVYYKHKSVCTFSKKYFSVSCFRHCQGSSNDCFGTLHYAMCREAHMHTLWFNS